MAYDESTQRDHLLFWAAWLMLLGAIEALYLGSYLLLMNHRVVSVGYFDGAGALVSQRFRDPEYRYGGEWAETIFWPLEWFDRYVRPEYWNP
jgi:hypothetical protein